jgi:hypothetical protein
MRGMSVPSSAAHPDLAPDPAGRSVAFDLPTGPAGVAQCGPVADALRLCLLDWPARAAQPSDPAPRIRVLHHAEDFEVCAPALPGGGMRAPDPLAAANALAGALTAEIPQADPQWVQLHAAAALDPDGRLELFLGPSQAGKSTLALTLARRGRRLFADDRLAVRLADDGAEGLALAVAPKLRLPAPTDWDAAALDWLAARTAARRADLAVLRLAPAELARLGERAQVARVLLLVRDPASGTPRVEPLTGGAALKALLPNCFAPRLTAAELLAWGRRFVAAVPNERLTYASAEALPPVLPAGRGRAA